MARGEQPFIGSERKLLEEWLEFQRATLEMKCKGLSVEQLASRSAPPSTLSLARILRHFADMERFDAQILTGRPMEGRYHHPQEDEEVGEDQPEREEPAGESMYDWSLYDVDDDAIEAWREECSGMRKALAEYESVAKNVPGEYSILTVRSILLSLIMEYARHNGHADLLRQNIDGATGY